MIRELLKKLRTSFSAKVVSLVVVSVLVTSGVVGLATTRSTRGFLMEKMQEKFPSILAGVQTRIRGWYVIQFRDLERLSQASVFDENLARYTSVPAGEGGEAAARAELKKYLTYVHADFPVYDELSVFDPDHKLIVSTVDQPLGLESIQEYLAEGVDVARFTPATNLRGTDQVCQWLLVPVATERDVRAWMVARIDARRFEEILGETALGLGGDVYLLDDQGRFVTRPRGASGSVLGTRAMQVPTRMDGPVTVETRNDYAGRPVFHSKVHLEAQDWWLIYEEDYKEAMAPVMSAQRRVWIAVILIAAIATLGAYRIVKSILRPINDLKIGARRINEGLVGVNIPRGGDDEISMMIDTFNEMARRISLSQAELQYKNKMLYQKNDELGQVNEKLETLSVTDGLTGLFNHRHFWNLLNTELTRVHNYEGELALILVDLDDFKRVNDQFGHSVGDLLLQSTARVLREGVRGTDIVARYGGEEFAILMPDTDLSERGAADVAENIRSAVESMRYKVPDTDIVLRVTVSIGVSVFEGNRREFFNDADKALYRSKAEGKNRIRYAYGETDA